MRSNSLQKKVFQGMVKKHFNTEQDAIANNHDFADKNQIIFG